MLDENPSTVHNERKQIFSLQSIDKGSKVFCYETRRPLFLLSNLREDFASSKLMYHPPQGQYFQPVNCKSVAPSLPLLAKCSFRLVRRRFKFPARPVTGLPSSVCVVDCAIDGFISDQISLSKGDALDFYNRMK